MISKELLTAVLGYEVTNVSLLNKGTNNINVTGNAEKYAPNVLPYNIYKLGHLVKCWIVTKGYDLIEAPLMLRIARLSTGENKIWEYTLKEQINQEYFKLEYVFKAGEYVLGLDK